MPPPLFLLSVEVPAAPAAACCAFLAAFSSSAFLSLSGKNQQAGSEKGQQEPTEIRSYRTQNKSSKKRNRRDPPLAALLRGEPVLGPLGVGLPRRRALAVALPLVAAFARVKDETTEQEQNPNNNRSKAKQRKCADLIGVGKDMSHLGASARPCLLYGQSSATTRRIGSSFSPK